MSSSQDLATELSRILEKGFTDDFVTTCAQVFEQYSFPEGNLSAARLYLFYLTSVIKVITSEAPEWQNLVSRVTMEEENMLTEENLPACSKTLLQESCSQVSPEGVALAVGALSFIYIRANKKSGEDFLTLFVESWLRYYSD